MIDTTPNLSAKWPFAIGLLALVLLIFGFGVWSITAQLAVAIISHGKVQVDRNRQVVQHAVGGVVQKIRARDGDLVSAGDILIELDPTLLQTDLAIVQGQLFEAMARRARLEAERDLFDHISFSHDLISAAISDPSVADLSQGQSRLFEARFTSRMQAREQLQRRRNQIDLQIQGIVAQRVAAERQRDLVEEALVGQQALLDRGLASSRRVLVLERETAALSGRIGELVATIAEAAGRQTDLDLDMLTLNTQHREAAITQLRDLNLAEADLAQRSRALLERLERLYIRAPVGGILHDMTVFAERAVIRAAEPLVYVVPQDRPLRVVSRLHPSNVDEVYVGQKVRLRFSAFNGPKPPEIFAHVTRISADALTDQTSGQPYYQVHISPQQDSLDILSTLALVPGMPVEAFIRTADQSPLNYLLSPLSRFFSYALKES
ncbi:MAG: HlyD family secretion protein [Dinoroseobacter sp.]|jgi:HlyD family secretion protein